MKARHSQMPGKFSWGRVASSSISGNQRANRSDIKPGKFAESDRRIADAALMALRWVTTIPTEEIQIVVEAGDVTLHGAVQNCRQKKLVAEIVGEQAGVERIRNYLRIKESHPIVSFPVTIAAEKESTRSYFFNERYEGSD